ncbi:MAG: glycosyltransferase family 39 protein [Drouetiella hepatica Uher 2000/2452]|uniref:Glycosyltransferase family 39 protein n=1 Tax=Drouetiella hepatica Uher 2000/2452 TaxID=904376 RepID=A0A951URA0_9CYAN|nr:glycosyltransferase family 39 protein [Drouetiella hepatica Uher 2000/2452]
MRLKSLPPSFVPAIALLVILLLGLTLRFWHLDTKPLWLDEVLTALFTTGHSSANLPLNQFLPLSAIDSLFAYQPGLTCAQIAQTVATESVHPPLFFCLMYQWLGWLKPDAAHWIWAMRALPALLGAGAIAALYHLNRLAFSPAVGVMGAALMAVSPFAVYLSQEGRHYTLPMLLITLALAGLLQIQQDLLRFEDPRLRPEIWLGWTGLNLLSLYIHYFSILAIVAQIVTLLSWIYWQRLPMTRRKWGAIALSLTGIFLGYLPWLPTMLSHIRRPETDWLIPYNPDWLDRLAPLYQTLVGWTLMFIALPVERQPQPIVILSTVLTLAFVIWLGRQLYLGFRQLWSSGNPAVILLLGFTLCVITEFLAIAYILNKDITVVPRYNFVYYPGVCALAGACLAQSNLARSSPARSSPARSSLARSGLTRTGAIVLLAGLLSSLLVVNGGAFLKSYAPDRVAKNIAQPGLPIAIGVAYSSLQEVALGLSFALELQHLYPQPEDRVQIAFIDKTQGYQQVWKTLAKLRQPLPLPLNLWVVASPGMRSKDYPERLRIFDPEHPQRRAKISCAIDLEGYHRIGFPYQLFRCLPK